MQHYLTRSILALTLTLTMAAPALANPNRKSNGPPGHSMRDFERGRGNGKFKNKNKHKVRYDRIDYGRDRRDYSYERARLERARIARMDRARYERARNARIEQARYERERLARIERARRERDRIIRARREECYDYDRGRNTRDRDANARDRMDVLRDRTTDIILGDRGNRCDDRRQQRPRVASRDPRNWPDSRERDWPRQDWPVPTYPRYTTGRVDANALATVQRALDILRTAP